MVSALFGLLPLYKPKGLTSTEVLNRIKRKFNIKKIGHTGTLDPFAEGLLIALVGKATRLAEYYQQLPKTYKAVGLLGVETDTYDITGKVVRKHKGSFPSLERLLEVLETFKGEIEQTPPPFSAKKIKGKRAYQLARRGIKPQLKPVKVKIYDIKLLEYSPPLFTLEAKVSGGTYIRSLIHDIGKALETGATTRELLRTEIGKLNLSQAVALETLENSESIENFLLSPDIGLNFPKVEISPKEVLLLKQGQLLPLKGNFKEGELLRVYSGGNFAAVGKVFKGKLKPEKVFL